MAAPSNDRRRYDHITPSRPLSGRYGSVKVFVIDVSVNGARIAHAMELPHDSTLLRFEWNGEELAFECEIMRTEIQPPAPELAGKTLWHSGLFFLDAVGDSAARLRELIADHVIRVLDEQKSNARGVPPIAGTFIRTGNRDSGYFCYRFVNKEWQKNFTTKPDQPSDGFTISAKEPAEQIDMLCKTYQESDFDGRKMIRKMAELSISTIEGVATRRYKP